MHAADPGGSGLAWGWVAAAFVVGLGAAVTGGLAIAPFSRRWAANG